MKKWETGLDIIEETQGTLGRFRDGTLSGKDAHMEIRGVSNGLKALTLMLEHARLTSRLKKGSAVLPTFRIGTAEELK